MSLSLSKYPPDNPLLCLAVWMCPLLPFMDLTCAYISRKRSRPPSHEGRASGQTGSRSYTRTARSAKGAIKKCRWACICATPTAHQRGHNNRPCVHAACPRYRWRNDDTWTRTHGEECVIANEVGDGTRLELLHARGTFIQFDVHTKEWTYDGGVNHGSVYWKWSSR